MTYQGEAVNIPFGLEGLTGNDNPTEQRVTQLIVARNVDYSDGTVRKEWGAVRYSNDPSPIGAKILSGWDWWPTSVLQRMIVYAADGSIYRDDGAGDFPTTLVTGLAPSGVVPVFAEGGAEATGRNKKLFVANGSNPVHVLDGDALSMVPISGPPVDWATNGPRALTAHANRMMGAGNISDPHRVYISTAADHETYTGTDSASFAVYPGEGDYINAMVSFRGILLIFKYPQGIYILDTTDIDFNLWNVYRSNRHIGNVSPLTTVQIDDGQRSADVLFMGIDGEVYTITSSDRLGGVLAESLSEAYNMDTIIRDEIDESRLPLAQGVYFPGRRQVHFAVTASGANDNNRRIILDFNREGVIRWSISDILTTEALWIRRDQFSRTQLVGGDEVGNIWQLNQTGVWTIEGASYDARARTVETDFGYADPSLQAVQKNGNRLYLTQGRRAIGETCVDYFWDGICHGTLKYPAILAGPRLDIDFILDTSRFGTDSVVVQQERLGGRGFYFSALVRQPEISEGFSVVSLRLFFTRSTEG